MPDNVNDNEKSIEQILASEGVLDSPLSTAYERAGWSEEPVAGPDVTDHPQEYASLANPGGEPPPRTHSQPVLSTDMECSKCQRPTRKQCPKCKGPFCEDHQSLLDPEFCNLCLNEPDMQLTIAPLKDPDGVTHEGRDIQVSGPVFQTEAKRISEMSLYQLEAKIDYYKTLIREAERTLDFRRVVKGSMEIELAQRKDAERRRLRGMKIPGVNRGAAAAIAGNGRPKQSKAEALGAALNLSPEKLAQLLFLMSQAKKK